MKARPKQILVVLFLIFSLNGLAQKYDMKMDSVVKQKIEMLISTHVNAIGYTKPSCIGYFPSSTAYLFWKNDKKTFIQKFKDGEFRKEPIRSFKPIQITDSVFFTFYSNNKTSIKSEKVERYKTKPDSISDNRAYSSVITTSHSCHRNFTILENKEYLKFYFDFFDLQEFHGKGKTDRNLNYDSNIRTKIVEWDKLISEFLEKLESENDIKEIIED